MIELAPNAPLTPAQAAAVHTAAERYAASLGLKAEIML
jgi:hypothetical protein